MDKLFEIIQIINNRNKIITRSLPVTDINLQRYLEYTKIHGPSSMILYKINNRLILFFRDVHTEPEKQCDVGCNTDKNNCVWISDFLKDLFTNAPMCIDFFCETTIWLQIQEKSIVNKGRVEHTIKHIKINEKIKGLFKTKKEFMDCLSPIKKGCTVYKKTRFHNIEFRRFTLNAYDITTGIKNIFNLPVYYLLPSTINEFPKPEKLESLIDNKKYDQVFGNFLNNLSKYKNVLEALLNNDMESLSNTIDLIYSQFQEYNDNKKKFSNKILKSESPYPKLSKQITALKPEYQTYLKEYILKRYNTKIIPYITSIYNTKKLHLLVEYLSEFYTDFAVLIFDTYAIARILKAIFNYDDSSLIITYAGAFHITQYEDFFRKFALHFNMDFEQIADIGKKNDETGCIQLNDNWKMIISYLQDAFNRPGKCAIKEGIPFSELA